MMALYSVYGGYPIYPAQPVFGGRKIYLPFGHTHDKPPALNTMTPWRQRIRGFWRSTLMGIRDSINRFILRTARPGDPVQVLFQTKFLRFLYHPKDRWFYAVPGIKRYVTIVPVIQKPTGPNQTPQDHILLLATKRVPQNGQLCIEFPTGLVGDHPGQSDEKLLDAAKRELLEETGCQGQNYQSLPGQFSGSPGFTDMKGHFVVARGLQKVSDIIGENAQEREIIREVFEVPRQDIHRWLAEKKQEGYLISLAVPAGLYYLNHSTQDIPGISQAQQS